jgi:hypothetical protein
VLELASTGLADSTVNFRLQFRDFVARKLLLLAHVRKQRVDRLIGRTELTGPNLLVDKLFHIGPQGDVHWHTNRNDSFSRLRYSH